MRKENKMSERATNFNEIIFNLGTNFDIDCQLVSFDVTKFNEKGNRYQDCVLTDGVENQKVKVWEGRNGLPLETKNIGQTLTFTLSARAGTGKWRNQTFFGGFWDSSAPIPNSVRNAPKTHQNAPQSTKPEKDVDWDAKDLRNARMNALNNATAMLVACAEVSQNIATWLGVDKIKQTASDFVDYIYKGIAEEKNYTYGQVYGSQRSPDEEPPETGEDIDPTNYEQARADDVPF